MKAYILRHSDAGEHHYVKPGTPPPDPGLTIEGREIAEAMAKHMKDDLELEPTCVIASPTARTRQTGKIVAQKFGLGPVTLESGLGPVDHRGPTMSVVLKKIASDPNQKRVVIISHHDNIRDSLAALNFDEPNTVDPIAKGELRVLDVNRKDGTWKEDYRCMPSDLGFEDLY